MLGGAIALLVMFYNNRFLGKMVRKLLEIDATTPETAMSLKELDMKLTPMLKYALRPDTSFSQTVLKTEDDRYYVAPDKIEFAKMKYRSDDMTIVFLLMSIVMILIVAYALSYVFPDIIEGTGERLAKLFGGNGNVI